MNHLFLLYCVLFIGTSHWVHSTIVLVPPQWMEVQEFRNKMSWQRHTANESLYVTSILHLWSRGWHLFITLCLATWVWAGEKRGSCLVSVRSALTCNPVLSYISNVQKRGQHIKLQLPHYSKASSLWDILREYWSCKLWINNLNIKQSKEVGLFIESVILGGHYYTVITVTFIRLHLKVVLRHGSTRM